MIPAATSNRSQCINFMVVFLVRVVRCWALLERQDLSRFLRMARVSGSWLASNDVQCLRSPRVGFAANIIDHLTGAALLTGR
jgi:hypothetical protein